MRDIKNTANKAGQAILKPDSTSSHSASPPPRPALPFILTFFYIVKTLAKMINLRRKTGSLFWNLLVSATLTINWASELKVEILLKAHVLHNWLQILKSKSGQEITVFRAR